MSLVQKYHDRIQSTLLTSDYEEVDIEELRRGKYSKFWTLLELAMKFSIIHSEIEMDEGILMFTYQTQELIDEAIDIDMMKFKLGKELAIVLKDNLDEASRIVNLKSISGADHVTYNYEFKTNGLDVVGRIELCEGKPIEFQLTVY